MLKKNPYTVALGGGSVIPPPAADVLRPTVTTAPTNITYNPVSYSAPLINCVPNIIGSAPIVRRMVFPDGADRTFVAGSTVANFTSFKPDIKRFGFCQHHAGGCR